MTIDAHEAHDVHDAQDVHDAHHSPEQIRREMRVYIAVFVGLGILTAVTVGVCYGFQLPVHYAIMVAMAVALTKGFLVAGFFMHLLSEKKVIYGVLALTVFFFFLLIWLPWHHHYNTFGS